MPEITTEEYVHRAVENCLLDVAADNNLPHGDMTPEQTTELARIRGELTTLLEQYVEQNTPR